MSSKAVRDTFTAELQAAFPSVQFVEGSAIEVDNEALENLWMGLGFAAYGEERLTLERPASWWSETGSVRVAIAGVAGEGDSAVVTQMQAVLDHFRDWESSDSSIVVDAVQPSGDDSPEADGRWLILFVDLFYTRRFAQ